MQTKVCWPRVVLASIFLAAIQHRSARQRSAPCSEAPRTPPQSKGQETRAHCAATQYTAKHPVPLPSDSCAASRAVGQSGASAVGQTADSTHEHSTLHQWQHEMTVQCAMRSVVVGGSSAAVSARRWRPSQWHRTDRQSGAEDNTRAEATHQRDETHTIDQTQRSSERGNTNRTRNRGGSLHSVPWLLLLCCAVLLCCVFLFLCVVSVDVQVVRRVQMVQQQEGLRFHHSKGRE